MPPKKAATAKANVPSAATTKANVPSAATNANVPNAATTNANANAPSAAAVPNIPSAVTVDYADYVDRVAVLLRCALENCVEDVQRLSRKKMLHYGPASKDASSKDELNTQRLQTRACIQKNCLTALRLALKTLLISKEALSKERRMLGLVSTGVDDSITAIKAFLKKKGAPTEDAVQSLFDIIALENPVTTILPRSPFPGR